MFVYWKTPRGLWLPWESCGPFFFCSQPLSIPLPSIYILPFPPYSFSFASISPLPFLIFPSSSLRSLSSQPDLFPYDFSSSLSLFLRSLASLLSSPCFLPPQTCPSLPLFPLTSIAFLALPPPPSSLITSPRAQEVPREWVYGTSSGRKWDGILYMQRKRACWILLLILMLLCDVFVFVFMRVV